MCTKIWNTQFHKKHPNEIKDTDEHKTNNIRHFKHPTFQKTDHLTNNKRRNLKVKWHIMPNVPDRYLQTKIKCFHNKSPRQQNWIEHKYFHDKSPRQQNWMEHFRNTIRLYMTNTQSHYLEWRKIQHYSIKIGNGRQLSVIITILCKHSAGSTIRNSKVREETRGVQRGTEGVVIPISR